MKLLINYNIYIYNIIYYYYYMIQSMDQRRSDESGSYGLTGVGAVRWRYSTIITYIDIYMILLFYKGYFRKGTIIKRRIREQLWTIGAGAARWRYKQFNILYMIWYYTNNVFRILNYFIWYMRWIREGALDDISVGSGSFGKSDWSGSYDPGSNPCVRKQWKYRLILKRSTRE